MLKMTGVLFLLLFLVGCTDGAKIKDMAVEEAEKNLRSELMAEAIKDMPSKEVFRANYVSVINNKSEIEIEKADVNDSSAQVHVKITTVPDNIRLALREVIERAKSINPFSFNITDALGMIFQQKGVSKDERISFLYRYEMKKEDGDWKVKSFQRIPPLKEK